MPRHFRARSVAVALALLLPCFLQGPAARAATPEQIEEAIRRGREYLLSQQKPEGRWETDEKRNPKSGHGDWKTMQGPEWGGYSSIATYALLASAPNVNSELQNPKVAAALKFLKKADVTGIYALGMRTQVWTFLPDGPEKTILAKRDAQRMLLGLNTKGDPGSRGLWDYDDPTNNGRRIDHSVAQYGVLGLWACVQAGVPIEDEAWKRIEHAWRDHQYADGGWSYKGNGKDQEKPTPSMTAAGVATLFLTQEFLLKNSGIACRDSLTSKHIDLGLKWMDKNFGSFGSNSYTWYGVERIGMASGLKYFGAKDWFATGADALVKSQKKDGSWVGGFPGAPNCRRRRTR